MPCGSTPARQPRALRKKRPIVSVGGKAPVVWTRPSREAACQSAIASYYVGPLND